MTETKQNSGSAAPLTPASAEEISFRETLLRIFLAGDSDSDASRRILGRKASMLGIDLSRADALRNASLAAFQEFSLSVQDLASIGMDGASLAVELAESARLLEISDDEAALLGGRSLSPGPRDAIPPSQMLVPLSPAPGVDDTPPPGPDDNAYRPHELDSIPQEVLNDKASLLVRSAPLTMERYLTAIWRHFGSVEEAIDRGPASITRELINVLQEIAFATEALGCPIAFAEVAQPIVGDSQFAAELGQIFEELTVRHDAIELEEAVKEEHRLARRQGRMRVGGYGIAGMLEAAVINVASGAAHATFNAVQGSATAIFAHAGRRRLMEDCLAALNAVIYDRLALLADSILSHLESRGLEIATVEHISARQQQAAELLQQTGSLDQQTFAVAIQSLQLSVIENHAALGLIGRMLLQEPNWEKRLLSFAAFVTRHGPDDFFVADRSAGSDLLESCVRHVVRADADAKLAKATLSVLAARFPEWWRAKAVLVLIETSGAAIATCLNRCDDAAAVGSAKRKLAAIIGLNEREVMAAAGPARLSWIRQSIGKAIRGTDIGTDLKRMPDLLHSSEAEIRSVIAAAYQEAFLAGLAQDDPSNTLALLGGMRRLDTIWHIQHLASTIQANEAEVGQWLEHRVADLLSDWRLVDLAAVGGCIAVVSDGDAAAVLERTLVLERVLREIAGQDDVIRPGAMLDAVEVAWELDTGAVWREIAADELSEALLARKIVGESQYRERAARLFDGAREVDTNAAVWRSACHLLATPPQRADAPAVLLEIASVLGISDERLDPKAAAEPLAMLRQKMLDGIAEFPGELASVDAPAIATTLAMVRKYHYLAGSGIIAVRLGTRADRTFVLTLGGLYDANGRCVRYRDLRDIEGVGGWTQDYVKFRTGDYVREINHLGDRMVADVFAKLMTNGSAMASDASDDPVVASFAGDDPLIEMLLALWAAPAPFVLSITDEKKRLPSDMVVQHLLTTLAPSNPSNAGAGTPTQAAVSPDTDLSAFLLRFCAERQAKDFAAGDAIDPRKLSYARKSFPIPKDLTVFGLIDGTVLGTNEKGMAITAHGLYWRNGMFEKTLVTHLSWSAFCDLEIVRGSSQVAIGAGNIIDLTGSTFESKACADMLLALQAALRLLKLTGDRSLADLAGELPGKPLIDAAWQDVIFWACDTFSGGAIPTGAKIANRKLANARVALSVPVGSEVLALIDTTIMGSNKNGIALCSDGIYWRNGWGQDTGSTNFAPWKGLAGTNVQATSDKVILGNLGHIWLTGATTKAASLRELIIALRDHPACPTL